VDGLADREQTRTSPEHALVNVGVWCDTVRTQNNERHNEKESKNDSNHL
jgi:hypothetical protein